MTSSRLSSPPRDEATEPLPTELEEGWKREQEALAKCVIQFDDFTPTDLSSNAFAPSHHTCTNSCVDACVREALEAAASGPQGPLSSICLVGGVDVSFDSLGRSSVAGLVVLSFPDLRVVWEGFKHVDLRVPYRAGFLAFREVEPFRALLRRCESAGYRPDVTLVDGNGVLHARRCGSATHLGVVTSCPTVGVAKNVLCEGGITKRSVMDAFGPRCDDTSPASLDRMEGVGLVADTGEVLGAALRGFKGSRRPVYISVGHRVSLRTAVGLVAECCLHSRIPEPIRQADLRTRAHVRARRVE